MNRLSIIARRAIVASVVMATLFACASMFVAMFPQTALAQQAMRIVSALPAGDNDIGNVDIEFGGNAAATGSGAANSGTQRVLEANDSLVVTGLGQTTDAAATAGSTGSINAKLRLITTQLSTLMSGINIAQIGGEAVGAGKCDDPDKVTSVNINAGAGTSTIELVAINASDVVHVCGYTVKTGAAATVALITGTGSTCGTGTATFETWAFTAAGEGIAIANTGSTQHRTGAGAAVCLSRSASTALTGTLKVVQEP